jgi:hypothetical protein
MAKVSQVYDDTNRGALFRNPDKQQPDDRDYRGELNVGGIEYWVSGWKKTSAKSGLQYISLSLKPKQPKQAPAKEAVTDDMADEVPF